MKALRFHELRKDFGRTRALAGISGVFEPGRVVAITGGNGSGKSTFLKILAGVVRQDSGSLEGPGHGDLAYMPERLAFARGWTARSWLELQASWRGTGREKLDLILDEAGLREVQDRSVSTFSHGMIRRLLYAQTRLGDPGFLLLDEPEGGLDPVWMFRLEGEMRRLKEEGRAVVFSTHAIDLAVDVADELWVFREGLVADKGPADSWRSLGGSGRRRRLAGMIDP